MFFQFSADFIQFSFHFFCDVAITWSVSINRTLLSQLFFDLPCDLHAGTICILVAHACMISFMSWRLNCWSPSLSAVLFSSCSRSQYCGTVTSSFPASQASCRVTFPPCCSYAEVVRILLTLISPICVWKDKTYRHNWKQFNYGSFWSYTHKHSQTPIFYIWMLLILL